MSEQSKLSFKHIYYNIHYNRATPDCWIANINF